MIRSFIILPIVLWALSGCGGQKAITTKYYVIEIYDDTEEPGNADQKTHIDKYCEIQEVDVYPAYASTQIANRSDLRELTYYAHHQWAIRPSESFTRIILDFFSHKPIFKGASNRFWREEPEYRVETTVYHLEVIQEKNIFSAHLEVEFRLVETETGTDVVIHRADEIIELEEKDINLMASAVGDIFYRELIKFSIKIVEEVP
jgi:ABC-type uncharacterized transport system auxiliary subunit